MKVMLYRKDDHDAPPVEREAVDAREILADPDTLYTMTPDDPNATPHKIMIGGMSQSGLTFINSVGLTADELAGLSFEEVGVRMDLKVMNERDVSALRAWHQAAAERRKQIDQHLPPQPGQPRKAASHPEASNRKG